MDQCFRFRDFELDVSAYALRRGGARIQLERIPMEVLILLVMRAGSLVTRQEILDTLWGARVFVEPEAAVNTAIRKIRRALDEDVDRPQFIETVVRKGYRFVAPVEDVRTAAAHGGSEAGSEVRRRAFPSYSIAYGRQEFLLAPGANVIGRDPDVQIYIDHASVSRRHASIVIDAHRVTMEDLNSRNGTFVNGQRISGPTQISDGAIIGLGPIVLRFVVLTAPASTQPVDAKSSLPRS